ncbi:unnamed protein product [Bathycoccus prasinos]
MKKITAGRGVLLAMALSLTFMLSTLYVVPVAGRTEVAVEASRTKSSRAEETNVPSFKIDGFVENETRASLSSSSSSSFEVKKKSASKRSKSSVANDSSAPMTKMPSSTTTVEPAVAGETDDLSEGFIRKGEIFAPANAAVFERNDEIVALGKGDNDVVDDSSLKVLKVEDPLVKVRKSDFVEKFDMSKNVHYIEPLDENGPLPLDYVPPESRISEDEFRAEFDAKFNNMTEAEAMLGDQTSALATGNDGEDGTEVPNLGTSASSDASSDDEETTEALMTSIPSEDDDAGTSVETGMGEEEDGERDEVSEDSTALPISDEEKLVGNDLDDHDPALATGNDGEDGTEVPNLGTSASSDASSDDEETIEALMTSIPSEDDDAGTSVETGMGEEEDGERDEVSEDSTALPISDEEKLVGNDLDDHDPALATGNDGEDGTEVPNLGTSASSDASSDDEETIEALMTSIPSEDDDAGTSVETGMGEEEDGERDEVSEDSTALPISDEEKLVGNDLDDHDPALATGNDGEDGTEVPNLGTSASSDASSDDEETIEALMTSIPSEDDDAGTSVETGMGEEEDGERDEVSEDSTALPISDEEKLVGNDLDDHDPALATGNDGEDGTEVPNLGTSASSDASSDDEETIEALMTSIPSEDDDAGTSVETGMGEEEDGERDEVSEDSTALPISDEEKLVGNDLDDHDPALATGNDGEDGTEVPNLGSSTQKRRVLDHNEYLTPPSSVESPNAVAHHAGSFAIKREEFSPKIYFDQKDRAEFLTQLPPDNTFKELSSDESLSATNAERILKSSALLDEYYLSTNGSDRIPGQVPVSLNSVDYEISFDVDVDYHGNIDADLGIGFDQNDAVSDLQGDSTFDEVERRYTSTIAVNSMGERESNGIAHLNIDADDFLGTRPTTRVSEVASMGAPFENHAVKGTNFNSVGNPKFLGTQNGWNAYGGSYGHPSFSVSDSICILDGLIKGSKWGHLATLPSECRPRERIIFNVNNHQYTTRVDVLPDGGVYWVAGGKSHSWLSLTGIKFVTNKGPKTQVSFLSGAKNYGGVWEDAYYSKINSECVLGGLIKKGSSWEVAQLPSTCRPEKALIFNVNNHQCTMRLNIYTDGKITASTGGCHAWVSLSGVSFIPKDSKSSSRALASSLKSSWVPYGGSWGHIATLPAGCRPYKRLIFNLNNHQYTSRVDVLPDGRVYWVAGGRSHGWLSLTGIRFEVDPPAPPSVSIGNPWKELSFDEFDFDIRVSHDVCSTSSCFGDTVQTDANVASGLKCEVFVRPKIKSSEKQKCTYDEAGTHLPCKNWDNFFDTSKSPPDTRTSLSLTNKDGNSATGEYEIWYNCFYLKKSKDSSTGWKKLHTFRVIDECSDLLPSGFKGLSIVEMLLHSSPSFLELSPPSCESVDIVKESIFREYDLTPQDGRLDENEVREALSQHDVDTSSLKYIIPESTYFRKKGGIMLSDFITSSTLPLACSGLSLTKASDIYFTEASYTNMDSDELECKKYHKGVHLKWDHKRTPQKNDRQCLYTDGRLLRSFKTDDKGQFVNSFKDERPSSGVGPDAVNLQVHISFDSNKVENIIGNPKVSKSPEEKDAYVTSTSCVTENNDGGKCFNRISASSSLELSNERQMSKSSVMTWIKPAKIAGNQYLWQSIGFESKFQKAFGIRGSGKLFVQLNDNVKVEGDKALQVNTWYHVAMTLNKANGIGLYMNGELNKSIKDVDNTQMDFPHSPMKVRILDAIALYDDLRIYTGIVTKLHISSIYSCGRRQSCAKLAHATPQSRRVYCIVPKYNKQKSSEGFVPPCAVGLFYNGAVIDLQLKPSQKGVLFSFRDTALHEISYEILRRPSNTELGALGDYKTVVMIDSALDFCATTFSSLTFFDDESIKMPGDIWEYAIKTKFKESTQISDPRMYTSPFYAMFEGAIVAGKSGVAVPNIRACTRIVKNSQQKSPLYNMDEDESNLSAYMYAWHSEQTDSSKRSSAFKVTDQDDSSYSKLEPDEWFNVSLASFSLISKVNVCTKQVEVQFDVRVVDYQDHNDKGDMGSMCILAVDEAVGTPLLFKAGGSMCRSYLCRGTRVSAYFGQSVSVKSTSREASISVSDIQVMGVRIDCPYTSFSDEEGNFEIDVLDLSGEAPRKAFVGVSAFKTDIFDEIDTLMVNATSQRTPEAFLIALAVDETRFRQNWKINKSALTDAEAACYLSKYKDLQTKFGKDLNEARKHYAENEARKHYAEKEAGKADLPKVGVGFETDWKFGESFNSVGNPKFLGTQNGWNAYGGSYGRPSFSVSDSICILDGLIKGSKWGHLATLPSECRPRERIIFNVNNHQYTTRVDVLPDGGVYWVAGGKSHSWLSLTGIKFVTNKGPKTQVSFLSGAKNYGGVWEDAYYSKINSECVLGGLIKKGSSWEVAQLPSTCRPEKALIFNVNNHQCTMRLNIYTDGKITASTGGCHAWVSLSGVSFIPKDSKSSSRALASSLKSSWVPYGGGTYWEAPSYTLVDGECLLQGLIQKGSWGHIATLPAECRPYKRLIFNLNNHQYTSRVDVLPDGRVYWVAGGKSHGWLSLTGIRFEFETNWKFGESFNSVGNPKFLGTQNGWNAYGGSYGRPSFSVSDSICILDGLIKGSKWGHLATLPSECRPRERIIFNVNNHQYTTRVDVLPDGGVYWVAGGKSHSWLSLTGIKFVTNKGPKTQVSFLSGAKNYGGVWEDAYYSKINSECVLGGLIKKGSSWEVAQLPSTCRPEKALIFNVNNHQCTMRLNIYTDGKITASTGGCHAWVSLSGVSFIPKDSKSSSRALASSLKSSWVPYGGGTYWEAPSYTLVDGECLLQGLIQKGSWGHIATLPAECRPYKRLIFNLNNHQYTSRVDVLPDGRVYWVAGGRSHGWLSLTGISFVAVPRYAVTLSDQWQPYGYDYGTPTWKVQDQVCEVSGLIYGSKWGHLATLPSECRPRERIIFNVNNHQYTTRVDVLPDGGVYWVAGGKSHSWLSLTGIKFVTNKGPKTQVSFLSGAKNYGGVWEDAYYSKINSECVLGGLIKKGSSWEVAQLPSTCRPEKALIFNVNNHQCTMRLNIYTDGKITASTGGCHAWVSLSGVSFIPKDSKSSSRALASSLKSSWVPYGGGTYWEAPSYTLVDGECLLQGLIQKGSWGHIATLPAECRPYKRLIFNLNNHQYTSRVDVLPDGRVYWVAGGKSHGWLSLTGISFIDRDGSGDLNMFEFRNIVAALDHGYMYAVPWLVYPTESWQEWVQEMESTVPTFDMDTPMASDVSRRTSLASMGMDSLPETKLYALTLATFPITKFISLKKHLHSDEIFDFMHAENGILKEMFEPWVEVHAIQRLPDVEHIFGDGAEKVLAIKHLGVAGEEIEDKTAVKVTGMVRFPGSRTQDFVCGLQFATISAYEGKKCDAEELARGDCSPKGYKYELEPVNYTADDLGRFDLSITPGETWGFVASYEGHDLCYGGDELDDFPCSVQKATSIQLHEQSFDYNAYYELENVIGGEFIVYFDVTRRQVDLGLYAGACGNPYTKYTFLITPANGCGAPIQLSDAEIVGSTGSRFAKDQWTLVDPHDKSSNVRLWPYAAMDYYIQLMQAPDVTDLTEDKILQEYNGASCKPPGTNIMQFFRDRDVLIQTMLLLKRTFAEVRYEYHGWFCVEPTFGDIPEKALQTSLTLIRADEMCIGADVAKHDLTKNHLIGTSNMQYSKLSSQLSTNKFVALKVVEAHYTAPDTITYCSMFERSVNDVRTKLGVRVQIQQDVGPQAMNPCHSSNEPSEECVFTTVNASSSLLQFHSGEGEDSNSFEVSSRGAMPNLVPPHRRKFLARVERNDGWAITHLAVEREMVTIASKIRGGGDGPNARYQSDTKFYATAPIRGLVYTVVHDPPGGNSFASIRQGTNIDLDLALETTRAVSADKDTSGSIGVDVAGGVEIPGVSAGSAYGNVVLEFEDDGGDSPGVAAFETEHSAVFESTGPSVEISATTDNGWDFHFTLDRTISSSADPALPGRPGDTILGGGFEIVYLRVDTVDVRENCLKVIEEVQWLPRKPTSYLLSVFHIEYKLLPELRSLIKTTDDKDSIITDGEMGDKSNDEVKGIWKHRLQISIQDWQRTLEWSTPDYNPEGLLKLNSAEQKTKLSQIEKRYDETSVPFTSDQSVFGRLMKPKIDDAYGAFTGGASKDWNGLSGVWKTIDSSVREIGSFSNGLNLNNIISGAGVSPSKSNEDWFPAKGSWLESWEMKGNEVGKNAFTSVENDKDSTPESLFSRGMSDLAEEDMRKRGGLVLDPKFFDKDVAARYMDSSVFGTKAPFSFGGTDKKDPKLQPKATGSEEDIYLTFSGGGHALEFNSDISSNIDSWGYSWVIEGEAGSEEGYEQETAASIVIGSTEHHDSKGKSAALERSMAWAKFGNLEVSYSLGDPDPYDKFVVAVSTDKRFGTPIFRTVGGASKCPGEPNTLWRESGLIVETAWATGVNNKAIPPGQNALFDIVITNESPYREGHIYGLLLTSGEQYTGDFGGNMMDLSITLNGADSLAPFHSLVPLHDVPSVDKNGDLKYTRLSLNVMKGQFAQQYSSIGVQLVSECEWTMSRDILYRPPISSTAFLGDFKWERECPKVEWGVTTYNTYLNTLVSKKTSPYINVTLMNPDPLSLWSADYKKGDLDKTNHLVHPNVEFVRVQWRRLGQGEWINSWDMLGDDPNIWKRDVKDADVHCKSARGTGCEFKWNVERQYFLNGLKDGTWEVRAKVFCSGYDAFATSKVKGSVTEENLNVIVDVTAPEITSVSVYNRLLTIDYSEPVTCPQLKSDHMSYAVERVKTCNGDSVESGAVSPSAVFFHYQFTCLAGERGTIMAKWPYNAEAGVYKLTVNADKLGSMVTDFASNPAFKEEIGGIKVGCESGADSAALLGNTSSRKESSTTETSGIHTFEVSSAKRAVALTTKKKSNKAPGTTAKAEISLGAARLSPAANFFSFTLPSTVGATRVKVRPSEKKLTVRTYVSDESVFGTLSKDKVKEVYKRPAEGMTLSTDIHDTDVWKDVQQTWDEIGPNKYLSFVPGLKEAMTLGGNLPTLVDMSVATMLKTASFIITPGDEIAKPWELLYSHPQNMANYAQTMIDAATSIFENEKGGDVATTAD